MLDALELSFASSVGADITTPLLLPTSGLDFTGSDVLVASSVDGDSVVEDFVLVSSDD